MAVVSLGAGMVVHVTINLPWQPPPAALPWAQPERPLSETVRLLQADVSYMVKHTAVAVHVTGPHAATLSMVANTPRGQLVPTGEGRLTQGHVVIFQDIGMPQPGLPEMTIDELSQALTEKALALGLGVEP